MPIDRTTFLERGVSISKAIISSNTIEATTTPLVNDPLSSSYYTNPSFPGGQPQDDDIATLNPYNGENNENSDQGALLNATRVMANIEKDRIPCPRLCGASFSCGVGGIASTYYLLLVCYVPVDIPH
jgi:hypothetical protein